MRKLVVKLAADALLRAESVVLIGQPGSGRSVVLTEIATELTERSPTAGVLLRMLRPNFGALCAARQQWKPLPDVLAELGDGLASEPRCVLTLPDFDLLADATMADSGVVDAWRSMVADLIERRRPLIGTTTPSGWDRLRHWWPGVCCCMQVVEMTALLPAETERVLEERLQALVDAGLVVSAPGFAALVRQSAETWSDGASMADPGRCLRFLDLVVQRALRQREEGHLPEAAADDKPGGLVQQLIRYVLGQDWKAAERALADMRRRPQASRGPNWQRVTLSQQHIHAVLGGRP